jgi:hypothetical protein
MLDRPLAAQKIFKIHFYGIPKNRYTPLQMHKKCMYAFRKCIFMCETFHPPSRPTKAPKWLTKIHHTIKYLCATTTAASQDARGRILDNSISDATTCTCSYIKRALFNFSFDEHYYHWFFEGAATVFGWRLFCCRCCCWLVIYMHIICK